MRFTEFMLIYFIFILTAAIVRFVFVRGRARLVVYQPSRRNVMNYLVAGVGGDPKKAYGMLLKKRMLYDGITLVKPGVFGYNSRRISVQLANDFMRQRLRGMNIFAISSGDLVIRESEKGWFAGLSMSINPIAGREMVAEENIGEMRFLGYFLKVLSVLLGWIGFIPLFGRKVTGRVSLATLSDQLCDIVRTSVPNLPPRSTVGVILSNYDGVADVDEQYSYFVENSGSGGGTFYDIGGRAFCEYVDAGHNGMSKYPERYWPALKAFLKGYYNRRFFGPPREETYFDVPPQVEVEEPDEKAWEEIFS